MSKEKKEKARKILIDQFEPKLKGHKDKDGNTLNAEQLLSERQLNVIGLFDDSTPNGWGTRAVHQLEPEYTARISVMVKESSKRLERWKDDEKKKAAQEKSK